MDLKQQNKPGPRILIQMTYMQAIGGIETAMYQVAKYFKDEDITFLINATQDGAQEAIKRLEKYHKVIIDRDRNGKHEADIAIIFTPIMQEVPWDTIEAPKIYQFIHSDMGALTKIPQWADFKWQPNPKVTKVLSVSETARKGLKDAFGIDSEVVPNILAEGDDRRVFLFMSRASAEKGLDTALEMVNRFDKAGKDYVLLICSLVDPYGNMWPNIQNNKRIIYLPANIYNDVFYRCADYLISMSTCESWGYSIREAMANGVSVLGSRIPEIEKVVKDGVNGYLLNNDLSDLDIDKIFNKVPRPSGYSEEVSKTWQKVMKGEL